MAGSRRKSPGITPDILLRAYSIGLFPMAESADDPEIFWVEPELRGVLPFDHFHVSKSLAKTVRKKPFEIRFDHAFDQVIAACAEETSGRPSTWINRTIRSLYSTLFDMGHAHTVEAWEGNELVGGLYGVSLGSAFFGEKHVLAPNGCLEDLPRSSGRPAAGKGLHPARHPVHHRAPEDIRSDRRSEGRLCRDAYRGDGIAAP